MAKYYVTRGKYLYTKTGSKINPATKGFDSIVDARAYAYRLVEKTKESFGVFIDPNTHKRWDVGLGIVWIMKDNPDNEEIATIQWGQPNMDWPNTMYYKTPSKKYNWTYHHWTVLNKDGRLGKKYR